MPLFPNVPAAIADPYLLRAYALAFRGIPTAHPNPLVGCVIVRDGQVVGEGFHERAGGLHAEVNALLHARDRARGATAYVTLEPCNHVGKTGACVTELIEAGVSKVVIGAGDPNPDVAGGGAPALREAGIEVSFAEDPTPFEDQNEDWRRYVATGLPWVQAKIALTLDGRLTLAAGESARVTATAVKDLTMTLRAASDAVLVGASTLAIDDPALTVRDPDGVPAGRQPLRVVLARVTPPRASAALFADGLGPAAVLAPHALPLDGLPPGVRVIRYDADGGLRSSFTALAEAGVVHMLVEPGTRLLASLFEERLLDELVLYHAGVTAGADVPAISARSGTLALTAVGSAVLGGDAVTVWRPAET